MVGMKVLLAAGEVSGKSQAWLIARAQRRDAVFANRSTASVHITGNKR